MTGRLVKNLRSGHTAEDIGIMFLRTFCAVAQIRQEDDIGIDAVATLLREDGVFLYAENSFFVQIKSESVTNILYKDEEINWLINQDLPFFICTVNKKEDIIKIYTTNPAYQIIACRHLRSLQLNLTSNQQGYFDRIEINDGQAIIDIGPPIIISNLEGSKQLVEVSNNYEILKIWILAEQEQIQLRKLGFSKLAQWDTGESPDYYGKIVSGNISNVLRDLMAAKPYLEYLSNHVEWQEGIEEYKKNIFRGLKSWFKEFNVDVGLNVDKNILHKDDEREIYTD